MTLIAIALLFLLTGCSPTPVVEAVGVDPAVPRGAARWRSVLIREVRAVWGWRQDPSVFFGQVHQESRWVETAKSRFASGLTQFTPATAAGMQTSQAGLRELCHEAGGCPLDARWALRAMVLFDRSLWNGIRDALDPEARYGFMLQGYNAGPGWVARERARCRSTPGCEAGLWRGHVEGICLRAAWACAESRGYVRNILDRWRPLYGRWLGRSHVAAA